MTLLLSRSDLHAVLDLDTAFEALANGFRHGDSAAGQRVRADLPAEGTAVALLPGLITGIPAYTVKVNAKFPAATPALRGVICLHDLEDGTLLALLDSATVTAWRTGLAAALATDTLSAKGSTTVGVIGAGAQAELVLRGLTHLRRIDRVIVNDLNPEAATRFAAEVASTPAEVAAASDIIVLATWSKAPLLHLRDVRSGQHITSLGVDEPGKCELADELLTAATVIVDDRVLVERLQAIPDVRTKATFGEVLQNQRPGRSTVEELTVYSPVGLPWQDLALAWIAYQQAGTRNIGQVVDLLG